MEARYLSISSRKRSRPKATSLRNLFRKTSIPFPERRLVCWLGPSEHVSSEASKNLAKTQDFKCVFLRDKRIRAGSNFLENIIERGVCRIVWPYAKISKVERRVTFA